MQQADVARLAPAQGGDEVDKMLEASPRFGFASGRVVHGHDERHDVDERTGDVEELFHEAEAVHLHALLREAARCPDDLLADRDRVGEGHALVDDGLGAQAAAGGGQLPDDDAQPLLRDHEVDALDLGAVVVRGEDFGEVRLQLEEPGCGALRAGFGPYLGEFVVDDAEEIDELQET